MDRIYSLALGLWGLWLISWVAAAWWSDRTFSRPRWREEAPYRILTVVGAALIFGFNDRPGFWGVPIPVQAVLLALEFAGFAFCWWARLHLGRLWSATVGSKAGHSIVDTGPYGLARHPIYTGLILSILATVAFEGRPQAMAGGAILIFSFWIKARLEEKFLRQQLGVEAYDAYAARVPMLVPLLKAGR